LSTRRETGLRTPNPQPRAARRRHPRAGAPQRSSSAAGAASADIGGGRIWLWGKHAVAAALANPARRWHRLVVLADERDAATALVAAARAERPAEAAAIEFADRSGLARLLPDGAVHQGWALAVDPPAPAELAEVLRAAALRPGRQIVVVLDRVSDPHNVGAILRSAGAFGAAAVIVAEHGAPPVTGVLAKAASGALEQLPLVRATNLSRTLDRLKADGWWCCGLDAAAPTPLAALDLGERVALVLGSEGDGLRRLVREECDYLACLPTLPAQPSLNVSNAAAIALYELRRNPGDTR
jgi:23S rRNA (guanosine2251-2'-O)-methyltransferase